MSKNVQFLQMLMYLKQTTGSYTLYFNLFKIADVVEYTLKITFRYFVNYDVFLQLFDSFMKMSTEIIQTFLFNF